MKIGIPGHNAPRGVVWGVIEGVAKREKEGETKCILCTHDLNEYDVIFLRIDTRRNEDGNKKWNKIASRLGVARFGLWPRERDKHIVFHDRGTGPGTPGAGQWRSPPGPRVPAAGLGSWTGSRGRGRGVPRIPGSTSAEFGPGPQQFRFSGKQPSPRYRCACTMWWSSRGRSQRTHRRPDTQ